MFCEVWMEGRSKVCWWWITSFVSSVESSILGSTKCKVDSSDAVGSLDINNVVTQVNTGEVVAIEVDATWEWDESYVPVPFVLGYSWALYEVVEYVCSFFTWHSLKEFVGRVTLVRVAEYAKHFKLIVCKKNGRVFHGKEGDVHDLFFAYSYFFKDLLVCMPFSEFQMGVLRELNVAPIQLHQNRCYSYYPMQIGVLRELNVAPIQLHRSRCYSFYPMLSIFLSTLNAHEKISGISNIQKREVVVHSVQCFF